MNSETSLKQKLGKHASIARKTLDNPSEYRCVHVNGMGTAQCTLTLEVLRRHGNTAKRKIPDINPCITQLVAH